ncbi:MAG: peptide chain release factor N(5)-glutamine methyltransferase [Candidatus Riflebacteria bacterium]|nr:peptide chain release factor N(5)-glutamine methyltransferase [Candidatus Riflebacteria bacterium]
MYRDAVFRFTSAGVDQPDVNARIIISECLRINYADFFLKKDSFLSLEERGNIESFVLRRIKREPLQYIIGEWPFLDLMLKVRPEALIPRSETEQWTDFLIGELKKYFPSGQFNFADIGTGTGAIGLSIAKKYPESRAFLVDVSMKALSLAKHNSQNNSVLHQNIAFVQSDLLSIFKDSSLDLIVSNPPYIPESDISGLMPEVRDFEPGLALSGGNTGFEIIFRLITQSERVLRAGGKFVIEHGWNQRNEIIRYCMSTFLPLYCGVDYENKDRFIILEKKPK